MASRETILAAIRREQPPSADLPNLGGPWIEYADRAGQFAESLAFVGGTCVPVANFEELRKQIAELPVCRDAKQICSRVPEAIAGNVNLDEVADPHELEAVDLAVLPGEFGVAENGAIWVTSDGLRQRVIYFLVQHLVLVLPANELVNNMHEAYGRLTFSGPGYGLFLSGPSKTADIEQSLVIGAHGARSLTVYLVG